MRIGIRTLPMKINEWKNAKKKKYRKKLRQMEPENLSSIHLVHMTVSGKEAKKRGKEEKN